MYSISYKLIKFLKKVIIKIKIKILKNMNNEKYKRRANSYIYSNRKYIKLNNSINYEKINKICRKQLRDYDIKSKSNKKEYLQLKSISDDFLQSYLNYREKSNEETKIKNDIITSPFFDLINTYIQKGYKQPDLNFTEKNIFKRSLLIEGNNLKPYFRVNKVSKKEEKELNFIRRLKKRVYYLQNLNQEKNKNKQNEDNNIDNYTINKTEPNNISKLNKNISEKNEEIKEYNNLMKDLIDSVEKDHIRRKFHLNKFGLAFPGTTKTKTPIRLSRIVSPKLSSKNLKKQNIRNSNILYYKKNVEINKENNLRNTFLNYQKKRFILSENLPNSLIEYDNNFIKEKKLNYISDNFIKKKNDFIHFYKVIDKTKNNVTDYDFNNIKKIIYQRYSFDLKGKKLEKKIRNLDKQIMHLDKDLIKGYQLSHINI